MDWQAWMVVALVVGALVYLGRRIFATAYAMTKAGAGSAGCASGCGSCGTEEELAKPALVRIGRSRRSA